MSEKCFIDTTVILEVILRKEFKILEKLSEYVLHTSVNVLEEASFKIIFVSVVDELSVSRVNIFKVKDSFEKGIGSSLTETRLHALNVLKDALKIIEIDEHIFDMAKKNNSGV